MRRQTPQCASDLLIDRFLAGEVSSVEAASLRLHFAECEPCRARHEKLSSEHRYLAQHLPPFAALGLPSGSGHGAPHESPKRRVPGPSWRRGAHPLWVGAGSIAAALGLWLLAKERPVLDDAGHERRETGPLTRSKGGDSEVELDWVIRRGGEIFEPGAAEPVWPGDGMRFGVRSQSDGHAAVLSLDGGGTFSIYQDWVTIKAGQRQLLPGAVELDAVLGEEHLYGIVCERTHPAASLELAIRRDPARPALPPDCDVDHHVLHKERP